MHNNMLKFMNNKKVESNINLSMRLANITRSIKYIVEYMLENGHIYTNDANGNNFVETIWQYISEIITINSSLAILFLKISFWNTYILKVILICFKMLIAELFIIAKLGNTRSIGLEVWTLRSFYRFELNSQF